MNVEDIRSKDNQQYDHIGHGNDIALLLFVLGKIINNAELKTSNVETKIDINIHNCGHFRVCVFQFTRFFGHTVDSYWRDSSYRGRVLRVMS